MTSRRVRQTSVVRTPTPVTTSRAVSCPPVSRGSSQVVVVLTSPAFKGGSRVFSAKSAAMAVRERSLPPPVISLERSKSVHPQLLPSDILEKRINARRIINTVAGPYMLPLYHPYQSIYQPYISMYQPLYARRKYLATLKDVPSRGRVAVLASPLRRKKYRKVIKKSTGFGILFMSNEFN